MRLAFVQALSCPLRLNAEFPQIRIDYFRTLPDKPPPTACFLNHVHCDHLIGPESLKSPFVYCSPATKELLLRLEKCPHRMNFAKGIVECRLQTYKHFRSLLKPIPLETPTRIELSPCNEIQVTLFDANHMVCSVSFLVEGDNTAIFFSGDLRAEPRWVDSLARHPQLIPYTQNPRQRRLSNLYLDTTFANTLLSYLEFCPKAEGIAELLEKIAAFPSDTNFYFHAWTFGYEDVWKALSQALNSKIHLDAYCYSLYSSLTRSCGPALQCYEAPAPCGVEIASNFRPGIITQDPDVCLHAYEEGTPCSLMDSHFADSTVHIKPIISRREGREIYELGAGGSCGDLNPLHEVHITDDTKISLLERIIDSTDVEQRVKEQVKLYINTEESKVKDLSSSTQTSFVVVSQAVKSHGKIPLGYFHVWPKTSIGLQMIMSLNPMA